MFKIKDNTKLYHGTSEEVAKLACVKGLTPYDVSEFDNGIPRRILASTGIGICLTSAYPGLMAFETVGCRSKWAIIEIDAAQLYQEDLFPYEGFLLEKSKFKIFTEEDQVKKLSLLRQGLPSQRKKWKESLDSYGMCVYGINIPQIAITKVSVYDPQSNPFITKAALSPVVCSRFHKSNLLRQQMVIRWLLGENIEVEEWLKSTKIAFSNRNRLSQVLLNKHGLDIFHFSTATTNKKKAI